MRILTLIALIITCYYFTYYIYLGITNPIPLPGDSWDYHIPISKSILDGTFLHPEYPLNKQYFPGSSEAINSLFIFFHIPLTLSNTFAIFVLGVCCYALARTFKLKPYIALFFALTIVTLNAFQRWMNAVSIDVWVAVYATLLIILLEKPRKTVRYFLTIGFLAGMMIGSKYNVVSFIFVLFIVYWKQVLSVISFSRVIAALIPFTIVGLFWYIRNYLVTQNPFYPIGILGFPGQKDFGGYLTLSDKIWYVGLLNPREMINAAFGEYNLWLLSAFVIMGALIHKYFIVKNYTVDAMTRIFIIGMMNFLLFLNFPTNEQPWIMVSSFRYSYPAFIPLILGVFLLAAKYKKEQILGIVAIASMINVLSMAFYPKLIIMYLPLALVIFYLFEKKTKQSHTV